MKINTAKEYLEIWEKCDNATPEEAQALKEYNKALCGRYPFLVPHNRWSGRPITTKEKGYWPGSPDSTPTYNYEYTELDEMPEGWRIAFGDEMLEELREELIRCNFLDEYMIVQIKEKYGGLRWYDGGIPQDCKVWNIISKYEAISEKTCTRCGELAKWMSTGWIMPFCDDCAKKYASDDVPFDRQYSEVKHDI